jgi:hypothetical protein
MCAYLPASKSICCACIKISLYITAQLARKYARIYERIYASGIQALVQALKLTHWQMREILEVKLSRFTEQRFGRVWSFQMIVKEDIIFQSGVEASS